MRSLKKLKSPQSRVINTNSSDYITAARTALTVRHPELAGRPRNLAAWLSAAFRNGQYLVLALLALFHYQEEGHQCWQSLFEDPKEIVAARGMSGDYKGRAVCGGAST